MLEEESPQIPFTYKDDDGKIIFRDALIFSSISELRNTSISERQTMMEVRYQNWLEVKNTPGVDPEPEDE